MRCAEPPRRPRSRPAGSRCRRLDAAATVPCRRGVEMAAEAVVSVRTPGEGQFSFYVEWLDTHAGLLR